MASDFSEMPGPDVVVTPSAPPKEAPIAALMPAISSSAWNVRTPKALCLDSSCRMSDAGVIGYAPRNSGRPDRWPAATRPERQRLVAGDVAVAARAPSGPA